MPQTLVIPCFNEAQRLDPSEIEYLLAGRQDLHLILVDDGSTDGTAAILRDLTAKHGPRLQALILPANGGKAEAVRRGLLLAMASPSQWIGYADADFATPAKELLRILEIALNSSADAVLGSRVRLLGTRIERRAIRHYLGRVFATFASLTLRLPVYDTQCGAKFFRHSDALASALSEPFTSRWAFDVDLIGRLRVYAPGIRFLEVPLQVWVDVKGSKITPSAMLRAGLDLGRIALALRRLRRCHARGRTDTRPMVPAQE